MRAIDADAVPQEFWEYEFDGKWRGCTIKDLLDSQPTIQPEPQWIPVTERLPEKSGRYFVTERIYHINDKEHTGGFNLKTDFAEYSATEKKWRRAQALVVVAWMDNEPYKGVTE